MDDGSTRVKLAQLLDQVRELVAQLLESKAGTPMAMALALVAPSLSDMADRALLDESIDFDALAREHALATLHTLGCLLPDGGPWYLVSPNGAVELGAVHDAWGELGDGGELLNHVRFVFGDDEAVHPAWRKPLPAPLD